MRPRTYLVDTHPGLCEELLEIVGNPAIDVTTCATSSSLKAQWCCSTCRHTWVTAIGNRTRGSGCPHCARTTRGISRARAPHGQSLLDLHPQLAAQFVRNESRPDNDPSQLRAGSSQMCLWRCPSCLHEWPSTVSNRVLGRGCPACRNRARGARRRLITPGQPTAASSAPALVKEFVANVSYPGVGLDQLRPSSTDKCRWRCSTCGHEWGARVGHRVKSGSGCPPCGDRRASVARMIPKHGRSLDQTHPLVASQFVENISRPGRSPSQTPAGANDVCRWRCARGHEWTTTVAARSQGSGCSRCRGNGRSRFELEVAQLITTATGLHVEVDVVVTTTDRSWRVDLYVPAIDLFIDLDPAHWHKTTAARDARKVAAFKDRDYLRVRPSSLKRVGGQICAVDDPGNDPWLWTQALRPWFRARGSTWRNPSASHRWTAMGLAAQRWECLRVMAPSRSAATVAPHLVAEFVENLSRKDVGLDQVLPHVPDRAAWRCRVCDHEWQATIGSRAGAGTGCPACAKRATAARTRQRSMPGSGESLAELHPDIASELVSCVDQPDRTAQSLRPQSNLRCRMRCSACGHDWLTSPATRLRGRGCPLCGRERLRRVRTIAPAGTSLADVEPTVAAEFVACVDEADRQPPDLLPRSNKRCRWRCSSCRHEWITTVASRTSGCGCPACGRGRTASARATAARGRSLADLHPKLADEFVMNLDQPTRTATTLRTGSKNRCSWRCADCGHTWATSVHNRARNGTGCPRCARQPVAEPQRSPGIRPPSCGSTGAQRATFRTQKRCTTSSSACSRRTTRPRVITPFEAGALR